MLVFKKIVSCFVLALILISSTVFAEEVSAPLISMQEPDIATTSPTAESISKDLYIYNTDYYQLSDIVSGNIFASATKFVVNPRNNGGLVSGNLFLISTDATIESDVIYSNHKDKNDNFIIDSINSNSVINGNVYVLSDNFTLEAGSEIRGDLYLVSNKVNIEQDSVIDGNLFVTTSDLSLNGQVSGSVYASCENFNMNCFTYISRDLYLNSQNANISGVIYRNAFITCNNNLTTDEDFRVAQNLSVDYANDFTFSGEVQGNSIINVKNLNFKNDNNTKCIINGNLNYAVSTDYKVPEGIVTGEISTSKYEDRKLGNEFSFKTFAFSLLSLLVYVFVIVFLAKLLTPNAIEKLPVFNCKNILISLGIGFASLFVILILFIMLALCGIGLPLAFTFIIGYLFLLALALPLFINKIATSLKFKLNSYLKLLIVTITIYLISLIPVFGATIMFIIILMGIGQILLCLFSRKK